jgi:nitrate reductase gamma subunit
MIGEILLLKGVWENNRKVWWASAPFHWGLYLLMGTTAGLLPAALGLDAPWWMAVLRAAGTVGGALLAVGAAWLLLLRSTDGRLRPYTAPVDRMNLALLTAFGALTAAVAASPAGMTSAAAAVGSMLRLRAPEVSALLAAQMVLGTLFLLYLPFTRMVHFFAKYFTYHQIRWDDRPVAPGSALERRLRSALDYGVAWSGEHVQTGKTWVEVATTLPGEDAGKKGTD